MAVRRLSSTSLLFLSFLFFFFVFSSSGGFHGVSKAEQPVLTDPRELVLESGSPESVLKVETPPAFQALDQNQKPQQQQQEQELEHKQETNLIQILRFDREIKVSLDGISSLMELVQLARDKFDDPRISQFVTRTGDPIRSFNVLQKLPKLPQAEGEEHLVSIIAKKDGDRFLWSAWKVGEEVPIQLDGRDVVVRTLATHPRLFEIDNFIDLKECDHIINRAVQEGLIPSRVGDSAELAVADPSRTRSVFSFLLLRT